MEKKKEGLLGFVLLLVGIAVAFINLVLGLIITIFAFIISLSSMRKNGTLIKVTLVLSILAMCVQVFMLVVAYKTVADSRDDANSMFNSINESRFRQAAETYFIREIYTNETLGSTGILSATMSEIGTEFKGCDGYATYDIEANETRAYIKCGKYMTPGFDDSKTK